MIGDALRVGWRHAFGLKDDRDLLALSGRDTANLTPFYARAAEGAAFQTYEEAIEDNRIAARWVAKSGFADPIVIGHSNGGTLAVRHVADHPRTPKLVLLSAHCGGSDMLHLASKAGLLAQERLAEFSAKARRMDPAELMLIPGWWYVTTAGSFLDIANCPDILELAAKIRCPVTVAWSENEGPEFSRQSEEFAKKLGAPTLVGKALNHFTMIETLADPASPLGRAALNMLA